MNYLLPCCSLEDLCCSLADLLEYLLFPFRPLGPILEIPEPDNRFFSTLITLKACVGQVTCQINFKLGWGLVGFRGKKRQHFRVHVHLQCTYRKTINPYVKLAASSAWKEEGWVDIRLSDKMSQLGDHSATMRP